MRLALQHLDTHGLHIELPPTPGGAPRRLVIRSATGLRGTLLRTDERLELTDVQADEVLLDSLKLLFGRVGLSEDTDAVFRRVRAQYGSGEGELNLELVAGEVTALLLGVQAGELRVHGRVEMRDVRLDVHGGEGSIEAETLDVHDFELRAGATDLRTNLLEASGVAIGWGGPGFRLAAATVRGDGLDLVVGPAEVRGQGWSLRELSFAGSDVRVKDLAVERARARAALSPEERRDEQRGAPEGRTSSPPLPVEVVNWGLLDGLAGEVNVDVHVDIAVPVIGSRRATHRFRVPVHAGSIDYMRLEGDLSVLENVLLDFAVRDGCLVLERGIPLLPTRGRGKPLVAWDLDERDLALARENRVRLAVLPKAQPARNEEPEGSQSDEASSATAGESGGRFALRRLGVDNIDLRLSLSDVAPEPRGVLRKLAFDALTLQGGLEYTAEGTSRPGEIEVIASNVDTSVADLPLGGSVLAVERLHLDRIAGGRAQLWGLRPQQLEVELGTLSLSGLRWAPPDTPGKDVGADG